MEGRHPPESTLIASFKNSFLQEGLLDVTGSTHGQDVAKSSSVFPLEIFERIADYMFALISPPKDYSGSIHSRKPLFATVRGFMATSPALHEMGMIRWTYILTIQEATDWEVALRRPSLIRELICLDGVFGSDNRTILGQFNYLHAVSINAHTDVHKNTSGRFSYRDVFSSLPASVLRLEITCAHGPDLKIIEMVRECCPKIEALRLGRCSMFNKPIPCEFWKGFPFDHDAYIASDGTDDYAHSVAQEIISLSQLKHLRLGVYLVPSTTVLAHRIYHVRNVMAPALINWQQALVDGASHHGFNGPPDASQLVELYHRTPTTEVEFGPDSCSLCRDSFYNQSKDFEHRASAVMKSVIPSLESMEWMDWFTPSHLGVSRYDVRSKGEATGS